MYSQINASNVKLSQIPLQCHYHSVVRIRSLRMSNATQPINISKPVRRSDLKEDADNNCQGVNSLETEIP